MKENLSRIGDILILLVFSGDVATHDRQFLTSLSANHS